MNTEQETLTQVVNTANLWAFEHRRSGNSPVRKATTHTTPGGEYTTDDLAELLACAVWSLVRTQYKAKSVTLGDVRAILTAYGADYPARTIFANRTARQIRSRFRFA